MPWYLPVNPVLLNALPGPRGPPLPVSSELLFITFGNTISPFCIYANLKHFGLAQVTESG